MYEFDWARDSPYKKGQEIEEGSYVIDLVDYSTTPAKNHWTHVRIVRQGEGDDIELQDIPRGIKPEKVPLEHRLVTVVDPLTDPERYHELNHFLEKYRHN